MDANEKERRIAAARKRMSELARDLGKVLDEPHDVAGVLLGAGGFVFLSASRFHG